MAFRPSRTTLTVVACSVLLGGACLSAPATLTGQTLTLKRELGPATADHCTGQPVGEPGLVTEADRAEAARLASSATQAAIVGDHTGARDLLLRATRLDPESGDVAYLLGRAYEEIGSGMSAIREYCRYLALTPEAPDGQDVQARISTLDPASGPSLSPEAEIQFRRGVAAFDMEQHETAQQAFTAVIAEAPSFGPAYYNRGVVYAALGSPSSSIRDLERYVELEGEPSDADQVSAALTTLRNPPRQYSPGGAMLGSLVVPGAGQFYTGRSFAGFSFLAAAAGAVIFGELSERVQIECRVPPTDGVCQPSDIVGQQSEKPYRAAGYGAAAAVAIYAAIDAYRGAGRRNAAAGAGLSLALGRSQDRVFALPSLGMSPRGQVSFSLVGLTF